MIKTYETREEWLADRRCKITGTKLKDIIVKRGTGKKKGYYQLIADRLALTPDEENPMERGQRLEEEAIARFAKETGKEVNTDLVIFSRDDNKNIAFSPDGYIGETEVVEVKCLNSASHIEAFLTQEVPDEYEEQTIQPFIVNDKLETLYLVFYDPCIVKKDFFYLTITHEQVKERAEQYLAYELQVLEEIEQVVTELSF